MIRHFWSYLMIFSLVAIIEMDGLYVKILLNLLGIFTLSQFLLLHFFSPLVADIPSNELK